MGYVPFKFNAIYHSAENLESLWQTSVGGNLDQIQKFHYYWHRGKEIRRWNYVKLNPVDL